MRRGNLQRLDLKNGAYKYQHIFDKQKQHNYSCFLGANDKIRIPCLKEFILRENKIELNLSFHIGLIGLPDMVTSSEFHFIDDRLVNCHMSILSPDITNKKLIVEKGYVEIQHERYKYANNRLSISKWKQFIMDGNRGLLQLKTNAVINTMNRAKYYDSA
jgi:hypothetical protein